MALLQVVTLPVITLTSAVASPIYATSLASASITVQADTSNTGVIALGGSTVTSLTGIVIAAGESATFEPPIIRGHQEDIDINSIYAISATTGSKLRVSIMKRN